MIQWFRRYLNKSVGGFRIQALHSVWRIRVALVVLVIATLACNVVRVDSQPTPQRVVQYKLLPPATPTIAPGESTSSQDQSVEASPGIDGETPVAVVPSVGTNIANTSEPVVGDLQSNEPPPRDTPTFTPEPVPPTIEPTTIPPTSTPLPTPTPPSEWSFSNIRLDTEQYEGDLLLYGNAINNSDTAKMLAFITGIFYDGQNQVIADEEDTYDYWPIDIVPPGGQVPFELTVPDIQSTANFALRVEAEPAGETPHQSFEFSNLEAFEDQEGGYCVTGQIRNPGEELRDYLIIVATLYDEQDNLINFIDYDEPDFDEVGGDQSLEFYFCGDLFNYKVTRYELHAWGL